MDGGWKLFYSSADPQAGVENFISPVVILCILLDSFGITGAYKVKLLCLLQVYAL